MAKVKMGWVVRATCIGADGKAYHTMHEAFDARKDARSFKNLLKGMGNWEEVKMYRSTEVESDEGMIFITLEKAR